MIAPIQLGVLLTCFASLSSQAIAAKRVAFVGGDTAYEQTQTYPKNNATGIAEKLREIGFDRISVKLDVASDTNSPAAGIAGCENAKPDKAIAVCTVALSLPRQSPRSRSLLFMLRGKAYQKMRRFNDAVSDFTQAVKLGPNNPEIFYRRAFVLHTQRKLELALKDYNEAVRLKPDYLDARVARGAAYRDFNKNERALEDFNWAVDKRPNAPANYLHRALVLLRMKKQELAKSDYRKVLEMPNATNRQKTFARNQLGLIELPSLIERLERDKQKAEDFRKLMAPAVARKAWGMGATVTLVPLQHMIGKADDQARKTWKKLADYFLGRIAEDPAMVSDPLGRLPKVTGSNNRKLKLTISFIDRQRMKIRQALEIEHGSDAARFFTFSSLAHLAVGQKRLGVHGRFDDLRKGMEKAARLLRIPESVYAPFLKAIAGNDRAAVGGAWKMMSAKLKKLTMEGARSVSK